MPQLSNQPSRATSGWVRGLGRPPPTTPLAAPRWQPSRTASRNCRPLLTSTGICSWSRRSRKCRNYEKVTRSYSNGPRTPNASILTCSKTSLKTKRESWMPRCGKSSSWSWRRISSTTRIWAWWIFHSSRKKKAGKSRNRIPSLSCISAMRKILLSGYKRRKTQNQIWSTN